MPAAKARKAATNESSSVAGKPFHEQPRHRLDLAQAQPEISLQRAADEVRILDVKRLIQPQQFRYADAVFRRRVLAEHEQHRIADESEERERDEADRQHYQHGLGNPTQNEGKHFGGKGSSRVAGEDAGSWCRIRGTQSNQTVEFACERHRPGLRPKTHCMATPPRSPRPALAGHSRPLPDLGFRDHAATDPGRRGDGLFSALHWTGSPT